MHLHRSKQCFLTYIWEANQLLQWLRFCLSVAHACAFYHLFGKLMKTSLVQGKAPSRAAINAAEVSSCLLIINASSSRERLHAAKPASICIRLLEQWLLIMAGRQGCLRWREASMSYLVSRKVWKLSFFWKSFQKMSLSTSPSSAASTPAALSGVGCAVRLFWKTSYVVEVQSGVLVHKGHLCCLKTVSKCILEMKDELSMGLLLGVKHRLCELELNMHWA